MQHAVAPWVVQLQRAMAAARAHLIQPTVAPFSLTLSSGNATFPRQPPAALYLQRVAQLP